MKCSGDSEILHELVRDTTWKSEKHELIRLVSWTYLFSVSEFPLNFISVQTVFFVFIQKFSSALFFIRKETVIFVMLWVRQSLTILHCTQNWNDFGILTVQQTVQSLHESIPCNIEPPSWAISILSYCGDCMIIAW